MNGEQIEAIAQAMAAAHGQTVVKVQAVPVEEMVVVTAYTSGLTALVAACSRDGKTWKEVGGGALDCQTYCSLVTMGLHYRAADIHYGGHEKLRVEFKDVLAAYVPPVE